MGTVKDSVAVRVTPPCKLASSVFAANFELLCFPPSIVFSFPRLPQNSSLNVAISDCPSLPNIADRGDDASLPTQHRSHFFYIASVQKFLQGFPPETGFNSFENSFPARENFATCNHFVSSTHNLQKLQNCQVLHTPIDNSGSQPTANDSRKLVPNNTSSSHTATNFDEQTFETTRISFLDHLDECKKPLSTSYAIKNYL